VLRHMDPFDRHLAVMDHALARCTECAQQSTEIGARLAAWLGFVGLAYMATVTWLGADRLQEGRLTLGLLAVVVGAAMSTLQMLMQMGGLVQQLTAAEPALARVREVFAATEPEPHDEVLTRRDGSPATLRVEDLHFAWPGGVPVLRGATFTLAPSSWTALLGESGSGKSTVAAIMAGLVEPQHGKIVVDGWELARYSPRALRSRIAVVNQEPFLLNRSLRENLRLASRGASEDEMLKALVLAGLADFLDRQPRGLDQPVGDNGAQMSHGERCRLSLARVLLQRPGLVVLDEALTRLDAETAAEVMGGLRRRGATVLLLTHDRTQAAKCDQVLRLDLGRIADGGPRQTAVHGGARHG